ncbi:hypothetical protein ACFVZR_02110 [Streptomyces sp. NPDC058316]|uniref:hypothetical protein n=1 Tax=Streptomyces sp. NPDC058316 TaxID=3346442 RepID=UPI0036E00AD8
MMGTPAPLDGPTLELLQTILDAIDIPAPATVDDTAAYSRVLADRAAHAAVALRDVLAGGAQFGPGWITGYLRDRLAETPATGYRTLDETEQQPAGEAPDRRPGPSRIADEPATVAACGADYRSAADVRATAARQDTRRH